MYQVLTSYLVIQYLLLGFIVLVKSEGERTSRLLAFAFFSIAIEDLMAYFLRGFEGPLTFNYYLLTFVYNAFELLTVYLLAAFFLKLIDYKIKHLLMAPYTWVAIVSWFTFDMLTSGVETSTTMFISKYEVLICIYSILVLGYAYLVIGRFQARNAVLDNQLRIRLFYGRIFFLVNVLNIFIGSVLPVTSMFVGETFYKQELQPIQDIIHLFIFVPCQTVLVLFVSYVLLLKPEILNSLQDREGVNFEERLIKTISNASLDRKPRMTDEKYDAIVAALTASIEQERSYLNPDLTIALLAEKTGIKSHDLSFVINRFYGKNFNALINDFRTEHAKRMLEDAGHNYTIYQVALESGFNTESVFYTTFKRLTGVSPLEYRKRFQKAE